MRCSRCEGDAVIDLPYASQHLCRVHFVRSVRDRVRREWHRQAPRVGSGTIAVAVSGGKDSATALALTREYFAHRPRVRLVAVSVDEGIAAYRSQTLPHAHALAASLGIEHRVIRAETTMGITTDRAAERLRDEVPCGYCGVWRRQLLNRAAREVDADLLVLGFNLDDLAQTVLMNLARADLVRLSRMVPHRRRRPGLVPRVAPLALVPEREVYLFARLEALPFDHSECPHAGRAARNVFRETVWRLEEAFPGTRQALLRTQQRFTQLLDASAPVAEPGRCAECGEAASGELCRACEFLRRLPLTSAVPVGS